MNNIDIKIFLEKLEKDIEKLPEEMQETYFKDKLKSLSENELLEVFKYYNYQNKELKNLMQKSGKTSE